MSVHPLEPRYVVVGLGDGTLRLLDRRRSNTWQDPAPDSPLQILHTCVCVPVRPVAGGAGLRSPPATPPPPSPKAGGSSVGSLSPVLTVDQSSVSPVEMSEEVSKEVVVG